MCIRDRSEGNRVFAISKAQMMDAISTGLPVDAFAEAQMLDISGDFSFQSQSAVVTKDINESWETTGLTRHSLSWDADGQVTIEETGALTTGSSFDAARVVPEAQALLMRHPMGYLLVKGQGQ